MYNILIIIDISKNMHKEKFNYQESLDNYNNIDLKLDIVKENVWNLLKSRFNILNNKIFINKLWEKLICKVSVYQKKFKKLILEDNKWNTKSSLIFEYKWWCYYIDSLNSYDNRKGNWSLVLDIFLKTIKWKKVYLQDNAYLRDDKDKYTYIRLKNFYKSRWFNKSGISEFQRCNVLFKWNVNEWRIYYKYF